jgi:FSR family fosmidomycin resistance protein-like MFS transporter
MTAAIALFTLEGSAVVMVFGLVASVLLFLTLDTEGSDAARRAAPRIDLKPILRARRRPIGGLLAYNVINSLALTPFQYFLVKLLVSNGSSEWYGGIALTILSAAGVVGGLTAGNLSDRLGRRRTLLLTAALTTPLFYVYLWFENGTWLVMGLLVIAGFVAFAPRPVTLAVAQELLPEARGPMAGMMLAVGFVATSIAALTFGWLGDTIGVERAFWITSVASLAGMPFVALLPSRPLTEAG